MLKTFTLAACSAVPCRGGRFLARHKGKAVSPWKTYHRTFACFLCVQSTSSHRFPWQPGALPCPASSPGGSSCHVSHLLEEKMGKVMDVGQKKTCGEETRQEWEQVRKGLPSSAWQEVPSPALMMGCHCDWVSRGSANTSTKTACPAQGRAFQSYKSCLEKHWREAGKKHVSPSWRCPRSFL